ncbi:LytR family transcriptional regulator [Candidatus Gracilibacteria bacterium 28_42_T64]|nr:LytR family transcriptional regulator [Candidatus Gracilibacteria bacterium 28_42_T64]
MGFKKNKIKKTSGIYSNFVGLLSLLIIFVIGLYVIQNINILNFDSIDNNQIIQKTNDNDDDTESIGIQTEEKSTDTKKNDGNKINILIVGRGGGNHDAPDLTDTIILGSIDMKKEVITLFSLPRDLYVNYDKITSGKINGIYAKYSSEKTSKTYGMTQLEKKVTQITGEEIDFFVNIDFQGFTKIIDSIGGIPITVSNNFVDNQYPDGKGGYRTLVFKKGTWLFDGDSALKYARSRHSTSDFDRSLRQQQVIKAFKDKMTTGYFLKSPKKIKEFYDVFTKYVTTDVDFENIIKFSYTLKKVKEFKILSHSLNDSCFYGSSTCDKGGFLYVPNREYFSGMSILLIEGTDKNNLSKYEQLHSYTQMIFNDQELFLENHKVNIFNSLKVNHLAGSLSNNVKRFGFNIPEKGSIGNTKKIYEKSVILYNKDIKDSVTLKKMRGFFSGEFQQVDKPLYSSDIDTKIEIIIGEDYLNKDNTFHF